MEKLTIRKANGIQYLYIKNTMTAKTRKRKPKKTKLNGVWIFLAIVIVIAIISMLLSYFWISEEKPDVLLLPAQEQTKETTPKQTAPIVANEIQGTWVSNYDGAMLTISGLDFELELSGIDETEKISGKLSVEANIVTFVYTSGTKVCKGPEGHYLYSIDESGDLFFKLIKDTCESRKERMTANWFSL